MFVASGPIEVVASHHTAATARLGKGAFHALHRADPLQPSSPVKALR
jgi:hypothetical protein